jgi:hypothetical protein
MDSEARMSYKRTMTFWRIRSTREVLIEKMTNPTPVSWLCYLAKLLECRCVDLELYHSGDDFVQFGDITTLIGVIKSYS